MSDRVLQGRDERWQNMVKIPYVRNLGKKRERGRERRERWEWTGLEAPFYFFLVDLSTLECRGLRSSMAWFLILPFVDFGACWSTGARARACLHAGAQGAALERGFLTSRILISLLLLISNTPQAIVLHLFTFTNYFTNFK